MSSDCHGGLPGHEKSWPFIFQDGRPLTRTRFVESVRAALTSAGVDSTGISRGEQHWHQQGWTALASAGVDSTGISRGGQHWHQQGWTALASAGVDSTGISRGEQHWHQQGWTALASAGVDSTGISRGGQHAILWSQLP